MNQSNTNSQVQDPEYQEHDQGFDIQVSNIILNFTHNLLEHT